MTTTSKIFLSAVLGAAFALTSAQASVINGTISFQGNVFVYNGTNATGSIATSFNGAESIKIPTTGTIVGNSPAPTGSFSGITPTTGVTFTYGTINLAGLSGGSLALPTPITTPLWSVTSTTGSTFTFTLSALTQAALSPNGITGVYDTLVLYGLGTIHDNNPADNLQDNSAGTWTATFNLANGGTNVTFSWSSSTGAPNGVPETGTSVMLLGLGLAAIAGYSHFRKQAA